jgi:epoxyqueuosine reductase
MISRAQIECLAREAGFDLCGVARARKLAEQRDRFADWLSRGYDSRMGYLSRNFDRRFDPAQLVEGARTVIVCAVSCKNAASMRNFTAGEPLVASYALCRDYHHTIRDMLGRILAGLQAIDPELKGRAFCDAAPMLEKAWAVEAGLGWQGCNGLIINPQFGSFILLGELVTDRDADSYSEPFTDMRCGDCSRCMEACPNGAIVEPRIVNTSRCISRLTIERSEKATGRNNAAAQNLHDWLFGCDLCQRVCPYNRHAPQSRHPAFAPVADPSTLTREFWQTLTKERFAELFADTPLMRRGYAEIVERIK